MEYPIWQEPLVSYCIIEKMKYKDDLFHCEKISSLVMSYGN